MNIKSIFKISAMVMAGVVLFSSCATIVSKSTYPVSINSSPAGASITINNHMGLTIYTGETPATVPLKASAGFFQKASYILTLEKAGFETRTIPLECTLDGWYFGNIFLGGFLGMLIIDPATGAMWQLERTYINETLKAHPTVDNGQELRIIDINEIPQEWKEHLVEIKN